MDIELFTDNELSSVMRDFAEIFQSRTAFQLDNFVLKQHDTEPMQYLQLCLELQSMMQVYEVTVLTMKKDEMVAKRLLASNNPEKKLEGEIQLVNNKYARISLAAKARELQLLIQMYREAKKFTREEMEADQAHYWNRRLTRQAIGERSGGSAGNFYAMWQAGMVDLDGVPPPPSILPSLSRHELNG